MDPYRSAEIESLRDAPRDPGIVGDIISQFADPNAFYRELIQNSIDAGTPSIEIRIEYDDGVQIMRATVADRGEGMTREVIENQLLVLFRSTKEHDRTMIGKFGIGFASVLAPDPDVVIIETVRDGRRLTVHLNRDLGYELFDGGRATTSGTSVTLEIPMARDRIDAFVTASCASLERWCRHASVPIDLTARLPEREPLHVRVNRPMALDGALVEVRGTADDGELVCVAGITADATAYTGFFNHGLMLHESPEPIAGRFSIKLSDSRLGHTLSRDDVRRDAHFDRAVRFAKDLAVRSLPGAAAAELRRAADADDLAHHRKLIEAFLASGLTRDREWAFPLVEPLGDQRSIAASALGKLVWVSQRRSSITRALVARGEPVLHVIDNMWLQVQLGIRIVDVDGELTSITPVDRSDSDDALLALVAEVLAAVHRAPELQLAKLDGRCSGLLAIAGGDVLVDHEEAARNPFAMLRRLPLVLNVDHPHVATARKADPILGATHLARSVLLHYRLLDVDRSAAILEAALARIGVT